MLSNKFPARLKKVLLLEPPSFFSVAFRIIRPLIPAKYLDKVATAKMQDLASYVDSSKLLPEYGGSLSFDAISYLDQLYAEDQQQQVQTPTPNPPAPASTSAPSPLPASNNTATATTTTTTKLEESKPISNSPINGEGVAAR